MGRLLVVAVVGMVTLLALPSPDVARAAAAIRLNPSTGPVGTLVTVTGTGFAPGFPPCEVRFGIDATKPLARWGGSVVAPCTVDAKGALSASFTVPASGLGPVTVGVCNFCTGGEFVETALATFTVTTAPTTTPPTTIPPPTTTPTSTTVPPPTSTVDPGTTTTTTVPAPVVPGGTIPDLVDGSAVPDFGPMLGGDRWRPITVADGLIEFPERWLERCAAPAEATTVDFDDLSLGRSVSVLIGRGVVPQVLEDALAIVAAPVHGTWSAPHAASIMMRDARAGGGERFRARPEGEVGFTYFGLRVGLAEDHGTPVVVQLAAASRRGPVVDVDRVQLGPERAPSTTCLIVAAPRGTTFGEARLSVYSADGQPVRVLYDGVFWSHDRAYPLDQPSTIPVEIVMPAAGRSLSTSRTTSVVGRVTWPVGQPQPTVGVSVPSWDGTGLLIRGAELGRPVTDGLDMTAVFWMNDVRVPSGPFRIDAMAISPYARGWASVSLEGVGPPTAPADEYRELLSAQVDVVPWAMEVTQAIRGPLEVHEPGSVLDDDFTHVAGKTTVVRGYGVHRIDAEALGIRPGRLQVDAVLHATRDGVTLPLSPLHPTNGAVPLVVAEPGPEAEAQLRPSTALTWNFELPIEWTRGGPIELRLEANPPTSPHYIAELPGTDGALNTIGRRVEFTDVGRVGMSVLNVDLHWRCTSAMIDDEWHPCSGREVGERISSVLDVSTIGRTARDMWRMWPAPGTSPGYLMVSQISLPDKSAPDLTVSKRPPGGLSSLGWATWRDAYYDVSCDGSVFSPLRIRPPTFRDLIWMTKPWWAPTGSGGCAWLGERSAFTAIAAGFVVAQEAGHTTGLVHTSAAHGEREGGSGVVRFGGDHGQLGEPGRAEWGFDTRAGVVIDPRSGESGHVHDFMSYGSSPHWVSVATWEHLIRSFVSNRAYLDTRGALVTRTFRSADVSAGPAADEAWLIDGVVADDGTVSLGVPRLVDPGAAVLVQGDDVVVSLRDGDGVVLHRVEVGAEPLHTHGGSEDRAFSVVVPAAPTARSLVVEVDGRVATELAGSEGELTITEVRQEDGQLTVSWAATRPDTTAVVEVSRPGEGWWPLAATDATSITVETSTLPFAGAGWRLRVQSSDGVTVLVDEADVDFGQPQPIAAIAEPVAGDRVEEGMVPVAAVVSTIGDDAATYTWLVDGEPVNEGAVAAVPMIRGARSLTLRVEAAGMTDEVTIDLVGVVDTDGDGFDDEWEVANGYGPDVYDDPSLDSDEDGLADGREYLVGTAPNRADSDDDSHADGAEDAAGSDPLDARSVPGPQHGLDDHAAGEHGGDDSSRWLWIAGSASVLVLGGAAAAVLLVRRRRR